MNKKLEVGFSDHNREGWIDLKRLINKFSGICERFIYWILPVVEINYDSEIIKPRVYN